MRKFSLFEVNKIFPSQDINLQSLSVSIAFVVLFTSTKDFKFSNLKL